MKYVVFWTGIPNPALEKKYGGFEWMTYSKKSWEFWCHKNNVELVTIEEPISELSTDRANWQKIIYLWDVLESKNLDPDKIFLVDASSIVKWDAPNIFEGLDERLVGWPDLDNLKWVYESIQGYSKFFNYELDNSKYINSGVIILDKTHKSFIESFKELYLSNRQAFIDLQDKIIRKGTEQTPFNFWLQMNNIDLNLDLPPTWKLTHLHRKEMLGYNWQLKKDMTPFFIKYGYIWFFTGFEKAERNRLMTEVWNYIKHNYEN